MKQGTTSPDALTRQTSPRGGVWYVYGVVPATFVARQEMTGLDDAAVLVEGPIAERGDVAVLVSVLDPVEYSPDRLEERTADVNWLAPRATAHDRVLTWASDRGPVVPFPMFSVFSGADALHAMLRERADELARAVARVARGREYGVRIYRVDAELLGNVAELSPRIAELERAAADASPGQRYLLERKLDAARRDELRVVARAVADDLWSALETHAVEARRLPIPRVSAEDAASRAAGTMVLNASFLIAADTMPGFQRALTSFAERHEGRGFRLDFTGPWPAYHFAGPEVGRDE